MLKIVSEFTEQDRHIIFPFTAAISSLLHVPFVMLQAVSVGKREQLSTVLIWYNNMLFVNKLSVEQIQGFRTDVLYTNLTKIWRVLCFQINQRTIWLTIYSFLLLLIAQCSLFQCITEIKLKLLFNYKSSHLGSSQTVGTVEVSWKIRQNRPV